ncbi:hypothetical protein [Altererythrobacter sp.]|uniref:hypothetical protein n=1 Tax=Altererythrobacter sp. TaxID=1872480 RepID=UPI001B12DA92|nr:hypothetical protein [Altererythrobacter sp.]MBO6608648.1 hypothetical protein [Altererythrobacter sp.]MBO6642902.1 hypothetical protein [Altererythrobacter sp.]MBO6709645.1 hypothetical protein [Altererythrobacter sp.]MBO6944046.1 hypothetical protein [Altererythrobacter sp.]
MRILTTALTVTALSALAACGGANDTEAPADEATVLEGDDASIASALSAGPSDVTDGATILDAEGNVLREGTNGWTCIAETPGMGPMCNDAVWMEALGAMQSGGEFPTGKMGVSYMLAGEGDAPGVSNLDPAATEPTEDNMWIKDGPHLMLILPDPASYAGMSSDIADPVYVMWKDTPFAHVMVRLADAE